MKMLKNFTVIEIVKEIHTPSLIVESSKLRLTRGTVEALEYTPFVQFLFDAESKMLAVQVTTEKNKQGIRFSKPKQDQKALAVVCRNEELLSYIWGMMPEWERNLKYKTDGVYSKDDKAVIFDLKAAQPYVRRSKKNSEEEDE
ncbi:MAG: hypothetical protein ACOX85_11635 [Candidatus Pararuminococcus gallinarum]